MRSNRMTTPIETAKTALRAEVRARINQLSMAERAVAGKSLCVRLQEHKIWTQARSVLLFAPMSDEPDIWPLLAEALAAGKVVALPGFVPGTSIYTARRISDPTRDLVTGRFGIREPAALSPEMEL